MGMCTLWLRAKAQIMHRMTVPHSARELVECVACGEIFRSRRNVDKHQEKEHKLACVCVCVCVCVCIIKMYFENFRVKKSFKFKIYGQTTGL